MRVLAVHRDVIVVVSEIWQTTCTAVRSGEEGFLIDSPILPAELEALPSLFGQAGFPVSGMLSTHGDWDHLLARMAFPDGSLGCAEATAARLAKAPGEPERHLRSFDERHYVERPRPLDLARIQELPVPGRLSLGGQHELELHPAGGHTADGMAIWLPWTKTLICGDYLSPVEIPMISPGGTFEAYLGTLERLAPLVEQAETVIPGHGGPVPRDAAARVLAEDLDYLRSLGERGAGAELPAGRRTREQRRIHARNARALLLTPPS